MEAKRCAVVTGASRGFGRALVDHLADEGWAVIGVVRSEQAARAGVRWVNWDVTDPDVSALRSAVGDAPVDLLVNNAGAGSNQRSLSEVDLDALAAVMQVNLGGVVRTTQALEGNLRAATAPVVVNVSSRLASLSDQSLGLYSKLGTSYAYRISKAAQNMTTICLSEELSPHVRVLAVHPGELATALGQRDAKSEPRVAAAQLVELLNSDGWTSPDFRRVSGEQIDW